MGLLDHLRYMFDEDYRHNLYEDSRAEKARKEAARLQAEQIAAQSHEAELNRSSAMDVEGMRQGGEDRRIGLSGNDARETIGYKFRLEEPGQAEARLMERRKMALAALGAAGGETTTRAQLGTISPELAAAGPDVVRNARAQADLLQANASMVNARQPPAGRRSIGEDIQEDLAKKAGADEMHRWSPEGVSDYARGLRQAESGDNMPFPTRDGGTPMERAAAAYIQMLAGAQGGGGTKFHPSEMLIRTILSNLPREAPARPQAPGMPAPTPRLTQSDALERLSGYGNLDLGDIADRIRQEIALSGHRVTREDLQRIRGTLGSSQ